MIDGRKQDTSPFNERLIRQLCHRRFGIGADGLIILEESVEVDFRMRYFNADGREGTMCGNGGRCITLFAAELGMIHHETTFEGIDGKHRATLLENNSIRLKLNDVEGITQLVDGYLLNTGSPHFVQFIDGIDTLDVAKLGKEIRGQKRFGEGGVNVNFVDHSGTSDSIKVRTYERGVESETYSCGTGVAAAAICSFFHFKSDNVAFRVETRGGSLQVQFNPEDKDHIKEVYLTGPASKVFNGSIEAEP
jgi:diaminopimelate epimerase